MPEFASALFASEDEVRQVGEALETLLREGDAEEAARRLEWALDALDELGHPIVDLCRSLPVSAVIVEGWDQLAYRLAALDRPGRPVTAIGIDIGSPGHVGLIPDEEGRLDPYIETNFYTDDAFPFSASSRKTMQAAYGTFSTPWQGCFEVTDGVIAIAGMERAQGAAYALELRCRGGQDTEGLRPADHDAMFVGSAFVAVRIHQAVREMVLSHGLPRPLTVMVGSNESYPFFDAPVITAEEYRVIRPESAQDWPAPSPTEQVWEGEDWPAPSLAEPPQEDQDAQDPAQFPTAEPAADAETLESAPEPGAGQAGDSGALAEVIELAPAGTVSGASIRRGLRDRAASPPDGDEPEQAAAGGGMLSRLFRRR